MLQGKNIAVFIDVDNCNLEYVHYENAIEQIKQMGEILSGKLYGVSEKKHKAIIEHALGMGFDTALAMRVKKRGQKVFDNRIAIDITEAVVSNSAIDAVAVVAAPADMVYLYRLLRRYDVKIIAPDNSDGESGALIDEIIDLGQVEVLKLPQKKKAETQKVTPPVIEIVKIEPEAKLPLEEIKETPAAEPEKETKQAISPVDRTEELLREIERLRRESIGEQEKQQERHEEVKVEETEKEAQPNIVDETQALLDQIARLRKDETQAEEVSVVKEPEIAPVEEEPVLEELAQEPRPERVSYKPQNDSDLIRKIEEMRANSETDDDSELVEKIKKMLEGLE